MEYISIVKVSEIRKNKNEKKQNELFEDKLKAVKKLPGYYKWWANKRIINRIFKKLELSSIEKNKVLQYLEKNKKGWYCIYVGIAKKSIRDRLKWHIFDKHTVKRVKSGILSTFRKTIASLFGVDMADKIATNKVIDKLCIEYHAIDEPKEIAFSKIKEIEKNLLKSDKLYILNIDLNKHPYNQNIKLKRLRKEAKAKVLSD